MRRHLLLILTLLVLIPSLAILIVTGWGVVEHERAMKKIAESYVLDLAQSVAMRVDRPRFMHRAQMMTPPRALDSFVLDISLPGWVALVDESGNLLAASSRAQDVLPQIWQGGIPVGRTTLVEGPFGDTYTIAAIPTSQGWYVISAVAWSQLLGPMVRFSHLWPAAVGLLAIAGMCAVWAFWRWLIMPLLSLESEVSTLKWGKDLPKPDDPPAVWELRRLRKVLYQLAQTAREREELRQRYVSDLVRVQEEERTKLAREIHDGPLQDVTALLQRILLLKQESWNERAEKYIEIAEESAVAAVRELRVLCDTLSPPWLDLGLVQALTELTDRLARTYGVKIYLEASELPEVSKDIILAFFRIAQEAINNAVKHGCAKNVWVKVSYDGEFIVLQIEDDGSGFEFEGDVEALRVKGHRGIANMVERMRMIKGKIDVQSSSLEKGTTITCKVSFPLISGEETPRDAFNI
ncbi:MAG: sensor histidine kinase [Acetomicrobium sp.]|jgi:signal transduction histidine kinase|uniref:sensor histidine kinase n=1 Tax=Acetomicrobium TaxID=49894 RepID=UPI0026F0A7F4|nr:MULTISPECIES: sensor histidine kinase [Acetomicrobium]MDI9376582.1 sensor histidine kinase [Synergistota bacterium]MDR9769647.1 sensor histidine kinase [Acetomicrobium sp.]HQA36414.1 sensor histidine kinase [Acetomicrobium sp.]HQC88417.1 sensor histidine kinase [Acetomicrobium sp.]